MGTTIDPTSCYLGFNKSPAKALRSLVLPESDWPQWHPAKSDTLNQAKQLFHWICLLFETKENLKLQKENEDFFNYSSTRLFKRNRLNILNFKTCYEFHFLEFLKWQNLKRNNSKSLILFLLILPKCHFWHIILDYTNHWSKLVLHWFLEILFLEISADQMPLCYRKCVLSTTDLIKRIWWIISIYNILKYIIDEIHKTDYTKQFLI